MRLSLRLLGTAAGDRLKTDGRVMGCCGHLTKLSASASMTELKLSGCADASFPEQFSILSSCEQSLPARKARGGQEEGMRLAKPGPWLSLRASLTGPQVRFS